MTRPRYDSHSTEFGLWLRKQSEIDSSIGFLATNIDYMWHNYQTGLWMLIEEKRHGSQSKRWQQEMFDMLDKAAKHDPDYRGFHMLVFENTDPDDGKMWLDGQSIDRDGLIAFLRFF